MLDSAQAKLQGAVRKAIAALTAFLLSMVLLTALLITGFYLLIQAAILALSPVIGEAAAMASVGVLCMLVLGVFFWRMTSTPGASGKKEGTDSRGESSVEALRGLIRNNPLEAALTAFAVGVAQQGDPRLRSLLMKGGMELMKEAEADAHSQPDPESQPESATEDAAATAPGKADQESGSTLR
ncbi:hypothetical protein [Marinobacter alexandrii]|jgi:hypothetical protein|uniref:hypothetical protein n=1 Tax=Marinobacter alexandrii TaxID=2570351 RepID=UPI001FFE92BD|nr:hypothetical protein [Marinobacter alexandrii]MCK2151228.1 hypothetical protein [Marinobacter alexandrii]